MPNIDPALRSLDVGLNNGRTYVQGSEMLARLVALPELGDPRDWAIERAQFHRMTDHKVGIDHGALKLDLDRHIASVALKSASEKRTYFLTAAPERAPQRTTAETTITAATDADLSNAHFTYAAVSGFWGLLDAVVQATKQHLIHAEAGSHGYMLTSLGANDLPLAIDDRWSHGTVRVETLRRFRASDVTQMMNRFTIVGADGQSCAGVFGFAFRMAAD
jgi:hypothetical protein